MTRISASHRTDAESPPRRSWFRIALWLAVSTAIVLASVLFAYLADLALAWRSQRDELIRTAKSEAVPGSTPTLVKAVFYGDSITAGFPLKAYMPPGVVAANRGVGGQGIKAIVGRYLDESTSLEADVIFIQGGINDLIGAARRDEDESEAATAIVTAYREAIAATRRRAIRTVVLSVHPVTGKFLLPYSQAFGLPTSFDVDRVNRSVGIVDDALKLLCEAEGVDFVDCRKALAGPDGRLDRAFATPDGYHLNVFGYRKLADAMPRF